MARKHTYTTGFSKDLMQYLSNQTVPVSASDIREVFPSVHKTTVYRQLQKLIERKEIQEVKLAGNNTVLYEVAQHSHSHGVCIKCGKVECIKKEVLVHIQKIIQTFSIESCSVSGLCSKCSSKK